MIIKVIPLFPAPKDHILLSNRSHAYLQSELAQQALEDAVMSIDAKPDWAKGYFRKAAALQRLERPDEAFKAYYECLLLEEGASVKAIKNELVKTLYQVGN